MKTVVARALLGLALLGGVATTQPMAASAQQGREFAQLCQEPIFRQFANQTFFRGIIPLNTTGECVSAIQALVLNDTESSRVITLFCQDPNVLEFFGGNQGQCIARTSAP